MTLREMAEWLKAAVLKTVEGNTSGGSSPSLPAINLIKSTNLTNLKKFNDFLAMTLCVANRTIFAKQSKK